MKDELNLKVAGHCTITDDLGNVLVDKDNAIHPQNMARIIARALANEPNSHIYRMAFGNGGTTIDSAFNVTFNDVNDGQLPDTATWDSRIYHEVYSEIIDVLSANLGLDPGSSDAANPNRQGGSVRASDPPSIAFVSGPGCRSVDLGLTSQVVMTCVLNALEPTGQSLVDGAGSLPNSFKFDEIGIYTSGAQALAAAGIANVDIGNKNSTMTSGLSNGTAYDFYIAVNGSLVATHITVTTPASGTITLGDLCQAINSGSPAWGLSGVNPLPGGTVVKITDPTGGTYPSIANAETYGFLSFISGVSGNTSSVTLTAGTTNNLFAALGQIGAFIAVPGKDAGAQNNPIQPEKERERLLAHLVFDPILKAQNRTLTVTYVFNIAVARSVS